MKQSIGEVNGIWQFLLRTWLVGFPVITAAVIGNFSWLNYEAMTCQGHRNATDVFIVQQTEVNSKILARQQAMSDTQVQILISLGKISTELELQRKK